MSLVLLSVPCASAQPRTKADVAVCIEHVGTRGLAEASPFNEPIIVASSDEGLDECHKDFISRMGKDTFASSLVVSSNSLRAFVSEFNNKPSLSNAENQPMGTYLFVVIAQDGKKTKVFDKTQTVLLMRSLMRTCGKGLVFRFLRDYSNWLDKYQPFPNGRDTQSP
jgi:hypothetical protein